MGFISRYVREQKRYTKNEIKTIFNFSESEAEAFIRRLKSFGVMKAVKNTSGQRDLSDLSDADIEIADDAGEGRFQVVSQINNQVVFPLLLCETIFCFPCQKYLSANAILPVYPPAQISIFSGDHRLLLPSAPLNSLPENIHSASFSAV